MIVACATDRRFAHAAGAMLASLFANGEIDSWRVVVFGYRLRASDKRKLRQSCGGQGERLEFIDVDPRSPTLRSMPMSVFADSPILFVRLMMPTMLGARGERLLYLDVDMLVVGSLQPLCDIDLGGHVLAAVEEPSRGEVATRDLPFPDDAPYFNSGLLLIDLDRWREADVGVRAFEFALKHPREVTLPDQDALNCVLVGRWQALERKWNIIHWQGNFWPDPADRAIVHFAGKLKPWMREYGHSSQELFRRYQDMTPWRGRRATTRIERKLRRMINNNRRRLRRWFGGARPVSPEIELRRIEQAVASCAAVNGMIGSGADRALPIREPLPIDRDPPRAGEALAARLAQPEG